MTQSGSNRDRIKTQISIFMGKMSQSFCVTFVLTLAITFTFSEGFLSDFVSFDELEASKVSKVCASECEKLKVSLQANEAWALKAEDASGRKPIEYFWGNNFFLGSEFMCEMLEDPKKIYLAPSENRLMNLSSLKVKSEFPVEYRVIFLTQKSSLQFNAEMFNHSIIHIGLCLPKSCSELDLEVLSNLLIEKSFNHHPTEIYGEVKFLNSKRLELRFDFLNDIFVTSFL